MPVHCFGIATLFNYSSGPKLPFMALLLIAAACFPAPGQQLTGSIVGAVTDQTPTSIPNAAVEIINVATQARRTTTTNATGDYEISALLPGRYTVTVVHPGFQSKTISNIALANAARLRVDVEMPVGEVASKITVAAAETLIETETARINETLTPRQVTDLPFNQLHNTIKLARFIPGTYAAGGGGFEWTGAGMGNGTINQAMDGITSNSPNNGNTGGFPASPSLDAVQEVSYTMVNQTAENPYGSTFSVITKSGSNEYHGSLWWFLSNNAWNARNFFATTAPGGDPTHRFGGTFGGPVLKNRLFFFADVAQEIVSQLRQYNDTVPTQKLRSGDFSGLPAIRDPLTNIAFPNNIIPASRINDTGRRLLEYYYQNPTVPRDNNFGLFAFTANPPTKFYHYLGRGDYRISDKQNLMARVSFDRYTDDLQLAPANPAWGSFPRTTDTLFVSVSHTFVLTPNLLNEARFGTSKIPDFSSGTLDGPGEVAKLGLTGYPQALPQVASLPALNVAGLTSLAAPRIVLSSANSPLFLDTVSFQRRNQSIKAGVWIRNAMQTTNYLPALQGVFGTLDFTGAFSGNGVADLLLGLPRTTSRVAQPNEITTVATAMHWFIQDEIQLSRRLTLTAGLRFEHNPAARESVSNLNFVFDPNSGRVIVPGQEQLNRIDPKVRAAVPFGLASDIGADTSTLLNQQTKQWYPRVGLAYRPFGNATTVVRAGYGMYALDNLLIFNQTGGPYAATQTFDNSITGSTALFQLPRIFPDTAERPLTPGSLNLESQQRERKSTYFQQWNFSVEHALNSTTSLRVSYIGNRTTHLPFRYNLNQPRASTLPFDQSRRPYPLFRDIGLVEYRGNAQFHGLTTVLSKRFSSGFSYDLAYLFSRDLGTAFIAASGFNNPALIHNRYDFSGERGPAPFTPRQRFTAQVIWQLPFGRGRMFANRVHRSVDAIAGGWQLSGFTAIQSGLYTTPIFSGPDPANTQRFSGRANVVGEWRIPEDQRTLQRWFNPSAFALPAPGTFGNAGPFSIQGPGRWVQDLGIFKEFSLLGENRLVTRIEGTFLNVFNHAAFSVPNANISQPATLGSITSTINAEGGGGRNMQFALRFRF
ncbi:MAG: carboxypeptidase regulatory-like domain-containing protein [Bryobacteraceae bacterium]|nr:carboxypeptidase regulatory-like domain-containing protein [Bryobacteraceae bacterium]